MPGRVLRFMLVVIHVLQGVLTTAVILPSLSPVQRDVRVRQWSARLMRILRIRVCVSGDWPSVESHPLILTSNHVSWVDIFALHSVHPVRFVSKAEVRHWPVFGWLAEKTGTLFLERGSRRQTAAIGESMASTLAAGESLGLFPESTTSTGESLLPFHSSMLQAAVGRGVPVLPVFLTYRLEDGSLNPYVPYVGEMTFVESFVRILNAPPSRVNIRVGPLVSSQGLHRRDLALQLEQITWQLLQTPSP